MRIGDVFGRWEVLSQSVSRFYSGGKKEHRYWLCRCRCGIERPVAEIGLKKGRSTSCGCFQVEASIARHKKHGAVLGGQATPEYTAFRAIIARCYNPRNPRYSDYGGRGIGVAPEWRHDFSSFLAHVGVRPSPRHSIDRMNNERGYEPGNVRWALPHGQMTNRRNSRFVDVHGVRTPLSDLAAKHGVPANTLRWRILKGWPLQKAVETPVRPKRSSR